MTDLVFSGCQSAVAGNNLHICSYDTKAIGEKISSISLITVYDTTNLYSSSEYYYDYMGIDDS